MRIRAFRRLTSRATAAIATLLAAAAAAAASPPQALAASTYTVTVCDPSSSAGGFQMTNQYPSLMITGNACGGMPSYGPDDRVLGGIQDDNGALHAEDIQTDPSMQLPNGNLAVWGLTAPPGTTISALSYYASVAIIGGDGWFAGWMADGQPLGGPSGPGPDTEGGDGVYYCVENINHSGPCSILNDQQPVTATGLANTTVAFGIACEQVEGVPNCSTSLPGQPHAAEADLYSAQVTITDPATPALSGESGAVWPAQTGTTVSGAASVTFSASDPAGIAGVELLGPSGQVLATQKETCDFSQAQPCPEVQNQTLAINTSAIANGPAAVTLRATNAAGGIGTATSASFTVHNQSGPTGTSGPTGSTGSCVCPPPPGSSVGDPTTAIGPATPAAGTGLAPVPSEQTAPASTSTSTSTGGRAPTIPTDGCRGKCAHIRVIHARYLDGRLQLTVQGLPRGDVLVVTATYRHRRPVTLRTARQQIDVRVRAPLRVLLRVTRQGRAQSRTLTLRRL